MDGDLAVSRALGDFTFKGNADLNEKEQKVTCFPDISVVERTPGDEVLILACDGLWDVLSSVDAVNTVRGLLQAGDADMGLIAEEMCDVSLLKGMRNSRYT